MDEVCSEIVGMPPEVHNLPALGCMPEIFADSASSQSLGVCKARRKWTKKMSGRDLDDTSKGGYGSRVSAWLGQRDVRVGEAIRPPSDPLVVRARRSVRPVVRVRPNRFDAVPRKNMGVRWVPLVSGQDKASEYVPKGHANLTGGTQICFELIHALAGLHAAIV